MISISNIAKVAVVCSSFLGYHANAVRVMDVVKEEEQDAYNIIRRHIKDKRAESLKLNPPPADVQLVLPKSESESAFSELKALWPSVFNSTWTRERFTKFYKVARSDEIGILVQPYQVRGRRANVNVPGGVLSLGPASEEGEESNYGQSRVKKNRSGSCVCSMKDDKGRCNIWWPLCKCGCASPELIKLRKSLDKSEGRECRCCCETYQDWRTPTCGCIFMLVSLAGFFYLTRDRLPF